jgi:hypothetical protein
MTYKLGTEIKCAGWATIAFTGKAVVITRKVGGGKRIPIGAIAALKPHGGNLMMKPNLTIELNNEQAPKDKANNENCVFYDKKTIPEINAMIEAIEEAL